MKKYVCFIVTCTHSLFFADTMHDRIDNVPYSQNIQQNHESQTMPISGKQDDLDIEINDSIEPISTMKDAVISDNLTLLKSFVSLGQSLNNIDDHGNTFLHLAVKSNAFHVAEFLVAWRKNHNVDFFVPNYEGLTPFDYVTNPRMQTILEKI
ncbi:MAG: ankyrin repeat domain-containing protein [Candidatus Chromulinivorax sp.]